MKSSILLIGLLSSLAPTSGTMSNTEMHLLREPITKPVESPSQSDEAIKETTFVNCDYIGTPAGLTARTTTPIVLESETIDITPTADKISCSAIYTLFNPEDTPNTVEIGFPRPRPCPIQDIKLWVDSKESSTYFKSFDTVAKESEGNAHDQFMEIKADWMSWKVTFPPKTRVVVKTSYWNALDKTIDRTSNSNSSQGLSMANGMIQLKTGGGWKGRISKATLTFHHNTLPREDIAYIRTYNNGLEDGVAISNFDEKSKTSTHVFEDFDPTDVDNVEFAIYIPSRQHQINILEEALGKASHMESIDLIPARLAARYISFPSQADDKKLWILLKSWVSLMTVTDDDEDSKLNEHSKKPHTTAYRAMTVVTCLHQLLHHRKFIAPADERLMVINKLSEILSYGVYEHVNLLYSDNEEDEALKWFHALDNEESN
ncbi:MAG: hypothetical protein AB7F75_12495 [Planctomycetota bacterium]